MRLRYASLHVIYIVLHVIGGPHTQTDFFFFFEFGDLSLTCLFKIRAKYLEKTILFVKETASVERHGR